MALNALGVALMRLSRPGDAEAALELFRRAAAADPGDPDSRNNLGNALEARGSVEDALAEYREAIRLAPGDATGHRNLGLTLAGAGRHEEARRELEEAVRIEPGHAPTLGDLGNVLAQLGRVDEALERYRSSLRLDPASRLVRHNLARLLARSGRLEDAITALRQGLDRDGDDHDGRLLLTQLYLAAGQQPAARHGDVDPGGSGPRRGPRPAASAAGRRPGLAGPPRDERQPPWRPQVGGSPAAVAAANGLPAPGDMRLRPIAQDVRMRIASRTPPAMARALSETEKQCSLTQRGSTSATFSPSSAVEAGPDEAPDDAADGRGRRHAPDGEDRLPRFDRVADGAERLDRPRHRGIDHPLPVLARDETRDAGVPLGRAPENHAAQVVTPIRLHDGVDVPPRLEPRARAPRRTGPGRAACPGSAWRRWRPRGRPGRAARHGGIPDPRGWAPLRRPTLPARCSQRNARTPSTLAVPSYIASERLTVRRMALGRSSSSATTRNPARTRRTMHPVARSPAPLTTTSRSRISGMTPRPPAGRAVTDGSPSRRQRRTRSTSSPAS